MLALDVGNTQTVLGYFKNDKLLRSFRLNTDYRRTSDEYRLQIKGLLSDLNVGWDDFSTITMASVVPRVTQTLMRLNSEKEIINVSHESALSFKISVPEPETVGADRLADIEGALAKHKPPFIIVDCGTAITFDAVSKEKEYLGGAITPGIYTSADALFAHASKLFSTTLERPASVVANTTKKQLQSGIVHAFASLIDGMVGKIKKELSVKDITVIGTGGQIEIVLNSCSSIDTVDRDLTLNGLLGIYRNEKKRR